MEQLDAIFAPEVSLGFYTIYSVTWDGSQTYVLPGSRWCPLPKLEERKIVLNLPEGLELYRNVEKSLFWGLNIVTFLASQSQADLEIW